MSSGNDPLRWIVERLNSMQKQLDEASRPKRTQTYASVDKIKEQGQRLADLQKKVDEIVAQHGGLPVYVVDSLAASSPSVPCVLLVVDASGIGAWYDDGDRRRPVARDVTSTWTTANSYYRQVTVTGVGRRAWVLCDKQGVAGDTVSGWKNTPIQTLPPAYRPAYQHWALLTWDDAATTRAMVGISPEGVLTVAPRTPEKVLPGTFVFEYPLD
ncbi:hypothetical protein PT279_09000 [Bifidobacterium sp. ESL0784]|uniref:hypothetical protein n=1 Tax=Bifidobacterium sp. ESL0784 TaxID=2983231 RepID=UPI0023F6D192|nr:hypothetical protein [Bifidobacterium sp. ESL0784]MDF7641719.1 hypothetical protein [Bifidobacterium sp. ESL0784]